MSQTEIDRGELGEEKTAKEELMDYVRGLEFGSVPYLAYCDYRRAAKIAQAVFDLQVQLKKPDSPDRPREESELRIAEQKRALLEFQTDNRKSEIRGYREAYDQADYLTGIVQEETALALHDLVPKPSEEEIERRYQQGVDEIFRFADQVIADKAN